MRDVGSNQTTSTHSKIRTRCIRPSPFQRDVGGSSLLDEGFRERETQGGTHCVGGPSSASQQRTTMNIVVRFLHSFVRFVQLTTSTRQATQRRLLPHHNFWTTANHTTTHRRRLLPNAFSFATHFALNPQMTTWKVAPSREGCGPKSKRQNPAPAASAPHFQRNVAQAPSMQEMGREEHDGGPSQWEAHGVRQPT